jgi:hypothetical protein
MATTTTRLALVQPVGSDAPVGLRTSIGDNATTLDAAVRIFEGTLVNRSSVTPAYGDEFYATDVALTYKWNGTAWQTVLLASAWVAIPPNAGVVQVTTITASARLVGDRVSLRGGLQNTTGSTQSPGTLPTAFRPTQAVTPAAWSGYSYNLGVTFPPLIPTSGVLPSLAAGFAASLDGVVYSLS